MRPPRELFNALRTSFWFLPTLMVILATVAAIAAAWSEVRLPLRPAGDDTGLLLSTLAGAMITVTGVVFSLTIISLHLASTQFGPRLMRSFMRDRATQAVLGTFLATFTYCATALMMGVDADSLGMAVALGLTAVSVGMLIFFVHHVATAIQAETISQSVSGQLMEQLGRLYPPEASQRPPIDGTAVRAIRSGYVLGVRTAGIDAQNGECDVLVRPGDHVLEGDVIARVEGLDAERVRHAIDIDDHRTEQSDARFSARQLAEMAIRALSPGINDPHTALSCIDRLHMAYRLVVGRPDGPIMVDGIQVARPSLGELLDAGPGAIRPHAAIPEVAASLMGFLSDLAKAEGSLGERARFHARALLEQRLLPAPDQAVLERAYAR